MVLVAAAGCLAASLSSVRADHLDGMTLSVQPGVAPGGVTLTWTGGQPVFSIYRSASAQGILAPANLVGTASGRTFDDVPPVGSVFFYEIGSPCVYAPPEVCNGRDDDCDGTIDGPGSEISCSLANAGATCVAGACAIGQCAAGFGDCDQSATDGCETPTNTLQDCGTCGHACAEPQTCGAGACICGTGMVPVPWGCAAVASRTVLSVGASGGCAVLVDGTVACWGRNHDGQLGLDRADDLTHLPSRVGGLAGAVSVGIRNTFACALLSNGRVSCWGSNALGELGDETTNPRAFPAPVHGTIPGFILGNVTALSVGDDHACAVNNVGLVFCWGANSSGQLGDGTAQNRLRATAIQNPTGSRYVAISAGPRHTCALTTTGAVECWGANSYGQLNGDPGGTGSAFFTAGGSWTPIRLGALPDARVISAGYRHNCAIRADGTEACWGEKEHGATQPQPGLGNLLGIAAGGGDTCAVDAGGTAHCWGSNIDFQIGSLAVSEWPGAGPTSMKTPVAIPIPGVVAVSAGLRTTCVATNLGEAYCWGGNFAGEAGNGRSRGDTDPFTGESGFSFVDAASPWRLSLPAPVASPSGSAGGAP